MAHAAARPSVQSEIEACALSRVRIGPNTAAMLADDTLHGGEPNPRARHLGIGMQALERRAQLACIGHIKTHAIVADVKIGAVTRTLGATEFNARPRPLRCEFPGVGQ